MQRIHEVQSVHEMQHVSDTLVNAQDLNGDWQGVVVEVASGNCPQTGFDGTLIYFPGVTLKELKG